MKSFNKFKSLTLSTAVAAALLATGQADATTTVTASIAVTANVSSSCGVTALPLAQHLPNVFDIGM